MTTPVDLVIPVRFDYKKGAADLRAANQQATQATKQAAQSQAKEYEDAEKRRRSAAKETAAFIARSNKEIADRAARGAKESADAQARAAKDAARAEERAANEASRARRKADREAFRDWKAGQDLRHRQTMQAWQEEQAGIRKNEAAIASLIKAQMGVAAIKGVAQAIAGEFKDAADYTRELAKDFIKLRQTMQEVATLQGKPNNNDFTREMATEAKSAHLTPAEYRDFQADYLNYAGSQVSGDERLREGQKLTASQSKEYAKRVAEFMKASGVKNLKVGAELAGSLLEQSEGPQDVDALMKRLGTTFNVLEKGRVPLEKATGDLSQIMASGVSAEDAAKMYSIVSPAANGEEVTSVMAALRAVQEMQNAGNEEFGVNRKQTKMEAVKSFAENIQGRQARYEAGGMSETEAANRIQADLAEQKVAADAREARGLVRGFGRMGARLGGFGRFERIERETPADFEAARRKDYEGSAAGKYALDEADNELAKIEAGERTAGVAEYLKKAETQLIRDRRFERIEPSDAIRATAGKLNGLSRNQMLINETAIEMAERDAGIQSHRLTNIGSGNSETNERILEAIERQNKLTERQNQILEGQDQRRPMPRGQGQMPMPGGVRP